MKNKDGLVFIRRLDKDLPLQRFYILLDKDKRFQGFYSGDPEYAELPEGWRFMTNEWFIKNARVARGSVVGVDKESEERNHTSRNRFREKLSIHQGDL